MLEILSVFGGGAFGGILSLVSQYFKNKEKEKERKQELLLAEQDRKTMQLEYELAIKKVNIKSQAEIAEKELEQEIAQTNQSYIALGHSIQADKRSYLKSYKNTHMIIYNFISLLLALVDVVRGLTRPVLTFSLVLFAFHYGNTEMIAIANTAVVWWFGDRVFNKK